MTTKIKTYADVTLESQQFIKTLLETLRGIRDKYSEFAYELEGLQSDLSNLYHEIEVTELVHVSKSHNLLKRQQAILRRRRVVKRELDNLTLILASLDIKGLIATMESVIGAVDANVISLQKYSHGQADVWASYFKNEHIRIVQREAKQGELKEFEEKLEEVQVPTLDESLKFAWVYADWLDKDKPMKYDMKDAIKEVSENRAVVVSRDTIKLHKKQRPLREVVLERDGYSCTICRQPATVVMTKKEMKKGEVRTADICISVCEKCKNLLDRHKRHKVLLKGE